MKTIDDLLKSITTNNEDFEWVHNLSYGIFSPGDPARMVDTGVLPINEPWKLPSFLSGTFDIRIRGVGYEPIELNHQKINVYGMTTINIPLLLKKDKAYENH